jgi:hypothetical protein
MALAPGWIRTDMRGPQARLSIEESIPNLANTIAAQEGKAGLQYLDGCGQGPGQLVITITESANVVPGSGHSWTEGVVGVPIKQIT